MNNSFVEGGELHYMNSHLLGISRQGGHGVSMMFFVLLWLLLLLPPSHGGDGLWKLRRRRRQRWQRRKPSGYGCMARLQLQQQ